jgi:hypothetical protein
VVVLDAWLIGAISGPRIVWAGHTPWKHRMHTSDEPHTLSRRALGSDDAKIIANSTKVSLSSSVLNSSLTVITASGVVVWAHTESWVALHRAVVISLQSVHAAHRAVLLE